VFAGGFIGTMPKTKQIDTMTDTVDKPDRLKMLEEEVLQFAVDRDWIQFHSPKNLTMALSGEVGELIEHFQWLTPEQSEQLSGDRLAAVEAEMADVYIYLIRLSQQLDVDLLKAAFEKIEINKKKYPAEQVRGSAKKYTEYGRQSES